MYVCGPEDGNVVSTLEEHQLQGFGNNESRKMFEPTKN
jgi:hypothetical protein